MKRREFLESCAVFGGAATLPAIPAAWAQATPRRYARARLVDVHGRPLVPGDMVLETNYVFQYPFAATPCLLLKFPRPVAGQAELARQDGSAYAWQGGVGRERNIVAFSAICAHKLAYPTREVSFIRYQRERSATAGGQVIHCCADHSVYDPVAGARVVSGPAPQPLAAIVLEYEPAEDGLYATGTVGAEQFDAFFDKYKMKLALEYGDSKARRQVAGTAVVRELSNYCRSTIQC
jgi:arsenite oxidase small subunit